jgi:RimJ/RimL family protein N-acetyltransferase
MSAGFAETPDLPLETERLVLRAFTEADAERYFSYRSLPETVRYLYREPLTLAESIERMPQYARLEFEKDADIFTLAIQPKGETELAGEILFKLESTRAMQGELGYSLHPDAIGKGYVTEAAQAMLRLGFEHFGFHRIFARIDAENVRSAQVAERLGMRREAHLIESDRYNGRWGSEYVYAILASEWRG